MDMSTHNCNLSGGRGWRHPVDSGYSRRQEGIRRRPRPRVSHPCRIPSARSCGYARSMAQRQVRRRGRSAEESALNGWLETDSHFMDLSPAPISLHSSLASSEPEGMSDTGIAVTQMGPYPIERA